MSKIQILYLACHRYTHTQIHKHAHTSAETPAHTDTDTYTQTYISTHADTQTHMHNFLLTQMHIHNMSGQFCLPILYLVAICQMSSGPHGPIFFIKRQLSLSM